MFIELQKDDNFPAIGAIGESLNDTADEFNYVTI